MSTKRITLSEFFQIDKKERSLVYGFCRKNSNDHRTQTFDVPLIIMNNIVLYHHNNYKFKQKFCGKELELSNNDRTVTRINGPFNGNFSTVIFGEELNNSNMNGFKLHFRWTKCSTNFIMGYLTSSIKESVKDFNEALGSAKSNSSNCFGIEVRKGYNNFFIHKDGQRRKLVYSRGCNEGDTFILSFSFKKNKLVIWHNDFIAKELSLNHHKKIIPAFALSYQGSEIEIIKLTIH